MRFNDRKCNVFAMVYYVLYVLYRVYGCVVRAKPLPNILTLPSGHGNTHIHITRFVFSGSNNNIIYISGHYAQASFFYASKVRVRQVLENRNIRKIRCV